jgi:serine/threonine protein kinase
MGAVYVGQHRTLQVPRAVKVLLPSEVDEGVVERFHREGQISASLRHPNIVQIFDVDEQDDIHFLVMELVDGASLLQVLRSGGALPLDRAVTLLRQVADALDYAHARGVVHRDIKPSNIIVAPDDHVTLIDFGIARAMDESRLTRVGVVVGTFEYMAPEIVTEGGGSPGADRYALGIVAYQMLTGRVPFTGESAHSIMYRQVHDPPPPPSRYRVDLTGPAEAALLRQLAKAPDERFPSAQAFVDALADALPRVHGTEATAISDITRPGIERPTPGSGQTPLPRSGRATRPVTAATLTPPPAARPLPAAPQAPSAPRQQPAAQTAAQTRGQTRDATSASGFVPRTVAAEPATSGGAAAPERKAGSRVGLVLGVAAVVLVLGVVALLVSPARQAVLDPLLGVAPTALPTAIASAPPTPGRAQVSTPATPTTQAIVPTTQPQAVTATPVVVTATPAPITPTAQPPQPTAVPPTAVPPTLTPNQRLAEARDAADAGNFPTALKLLDDLRASNPTLAGLDAATYDIHMAFAQALLQQGNPDGAYEQFGVALKARPSDPAAKAGQDGIILAKNYTIMEVAWGKDDDAGIKALEENMQINPDFRETRPKLYALLINKADRLIGAGERDAAFDVLMRALQVQPDAGAAQQRLASYTPTPLPVPTATPAPAYSAPAYSAPASQPASQPARTAPASQPAQQQQVRPAAQPAPAPRPSGGGSSGASCPGGVCP